MVAEAYDASIEAGASEDKARKAATVLADYDLQFSGIKVDLGDVRSDLKVLRAMNA